MSAKGPRGSGQQFNKQGVTQGVTLVDPKSGQAIDVITDNQGIRRLAVDTTVTIGDITVETRALDASTDNVAIKDNTTGAKLKIHLDGSIDTNVALDAASGDSALSVGTEDGTPTGTQHVQKIGADGKLQVKDVDANTALGNILTELGQKTEPSDAQNIRPITSASDSISVPGVATEAKQDTANASLASIDSKLTSPIAVTGDFAAGDIFKLVPEEFDDIEILAKNGNGDPTSVVYRLATIVVATLTLIYDSDGDFQRVTRA